MLRRSFGGLIAAFAVVIWLGPLAMAIFDMVTWIAGFGPVSGVDWSVGDRQGTLLLWSMFGCIPMLSVFALGMWVGDFE